MAFQKGVSGNKSGRPKETPEQKADKERFRALLGAATVPALESIIQIANDRHNKNRLNACKYIIDKAYGVNAAFFADSSDTEPFIIQIKPSSQEPRENEDEYDEEDEKAWRDIEALEAYEREWEVGDIEAEAVSEIKSAIQCIKKTGGIYNDSNKSN